LGTEKCLRLIDEIAALPSGHHPHRGEPLLREDIYELAAYGDSKGLRMVLATNGTLVTAESAGG